MSRFYEGEIEDEEQQRRANLYRGQVASQMRSKAGQAFLREVLEAIEALPDRRLAEGDLVVDGCMCSLAALALKRRTDAGELREAVLADLARVHVDHNHPDWEGTEIDEWARDVLDAPRLLAIEIPFENDDGGERWVPDAAEPRGGRREPITPEQRWLRMRNYLRAQIGMEPAA